MKEYSITIRDDLCKGCAICVEICPKNILAMSPESTVSGYLLAQIIEVKKCIGCMECELHCPDLAIEVIDKNEKVPAG
ncbi:MAG: 4Fe-4S binding protein [Planctomycetota bacterium]|nr:4Fe-4S binding protein [Planctomycetota bacterium]MDI6786878.1 4Fe-4S binding protein [Planctomycetota bacterium]